MPKDSSTLTAQEPAPKRGHSKALPVTLSLDQPGRLRLGHIMTLYSISHATVYSYINRGLIPKPDGKDGARPYWKTETIKEALNK
ncbi:hypothetical protein [Noviherbaspirillum sp.]|uniref:hypothetical protein n=1 Tax=Noviherbaspirillum sp. TaxID=1926288 RepID=UPI002FE2517B